MSRHTPYHTVKVNGATDVVNDMTAIQNGVAGAMTGDNAGAAVPPPVLPQFHPQAFPVPIGYNGILIKRELQLWHMMNNMLMPQPINIALRCLFSPPPAASVPLLQMPYPSTQSIHGARSAPTPMSTSLHQTVTKPLPRCLMSPEWQGVNSFAALGEAVAEFQKRESQYSTWWNHKTMVPCALISQCMQSSASQYYNVAAINQQCQFTDVTPAIHSLTMAAEAEAESEEEAMATRKTMTKTMTARKAMTKTMLRTHIDPTCGEFPLADDSTSDSECDPRGDQNTSIPLVRSRRRPKRPMKRKSRQPGDISSKRMRFSPKSMLRHHHKTIVDSSTGASASEILCATETVKIECMSKASLAEKALAAKLDDAHVAFMRKERQRTMCRWRVRRHRLKKDLRSLSLNERQIKAIVSELPLRAWEPSEVLAKVSRQLKNFNQALRDLPAPSAH